MKILVDADACPVVRIVETVAKEYGIHQSGRWYTNENIDQMMMERHLAKKARMGKGKHHIKGPAKRTEEDDKRFLESFIKLVRKVTGENSDGET